MRWRAIPGICRRPRRLLGRRGGGGGGGLWAAASGHRHRRLGPPAGGLVRACRPEAERRPRADRPTLYRPRRRADDPHRRRRRADDGDALAPDARDYMSLPPQKLDWRVAPAALKGLRIGLRDRDRLRRAAGPGGARAVERAARDFAAAGAIVEPLRPVFPPGDARRARPVLAHALADRHRRAAAGEARRRCCRSSAPGRNRRAGFPARRCFAGSAGCRRFARAAVAATAPSILS